MLPILVNAQDSGAVEIGASITATDDATPWLSPSGEFAFGFRKIQNTDLYLLSIWYHKIPDKTIVWFSNDGITVPRKSKVVLTALHGIVLSDSLGKELWKSGTNNTDISYAYMNNTGNFMLMGSDGFKLWDSFSNPTDTLLPTQSMEIGGVLYSRVSETNFAKGRFQSRMLKGGTFEINPREMPTYNAYRSYYVSPTSDPNDKNNSGLYLSFNETGYMYIVRGNGGIYDLTKQKLPAPGYYHRATLDFDGVFTQYYHPKEFTGTPSWTVVWQEPGNMCADVKGVHGSGACGFNNVCSLDDKRRPVCECIKGYVLLNPRDEYGSCKPNFSLSCDDNGLSSAEELYGLLELRDIDWPNSEYAVQTPISEIECKRSCLSDCFCAAAIYSNACWKKKLPLAHGIRDQNFNHKTFVKFRKADLPLQGPNFPNKKDQDNLILVVSVLLFSSIFFNIMLLAVVCLGFFYIYRKKAIQHQPHNTVTENNLRFFTFKELEKATSGFKEELGRGAFGIVYKGAVQLSSTTTIIAVKKLDRMTQDTDKEFKSEVSIIAQTHHKNLVRLVGFCDEGRQRLLVYEYMVNGTLARLLFADVKPGWMQRSHIGLGIARGLAYLHEECSTQIIHCDIKPQNILLDEYHNARISDFGLAKLLNINQSRTNTAIRGTKGYVAAEWFRNIPVTVKVDVYSFGVLLLEIICCRRSVENFELGGGKDILTDLAWDCFREGRLGDLVEIEKEDESIKWNELGRFVMVGIWCIQEDPSLRPTMRKVSQMLEGVVDVPYPPCPSPFSSTR
ncbi:hypothetical protein AgCh_040327 [Apium graveolens]